MKVSFRVAREKILQYMFDMYIFNSFYLLHSNNPSFLICLCFNMASFRRKNKAWATPRSVSFRGLIQNFRRASPPLSYAEFPPGLQGLKVYCFTCTVLSADLCGSKAYLLRNIADSCTLSSLPPLHLVSRVSYFY